MTSTPPSSTPTPQSDGTLQFGEWGRVTEQTATRPTDVRSTDRVVFRHPYDDVVWEATDGRQFLLVQVERRITDAPDDELVAYPDAFGYRVAAGGDTYEPRPGPDETNALTEPLRGGYAREGSSSKGAEGSAATNWLGFDVPADVAPGDVELRYVRDDGDPLVWQQ